MDGSAEGMHTALAMNEVRKVITEPVYKEKFDRHIQRRLSRASNSFETTKKRKQKHEPDEQYAKQVEANWNCKIDDCLPPELQPRQKNPNGSKVGHDQYHDKARLPTSAWTRTFRRVLARFSRITKNKIRLAHALLAQEIAIRQKARKHPEHYARETLTSDIDAAFKRMRTLTKQYDEGHPDAEMRELAQTRKKNEVAPHDSISNISWNDEEDSLLPRPMPIPLKKKLAKSRRAAICQGVELQE